MAESMHKMSYVSSEITKVAGQVGGLVWEGVLDQIWNQALDQTRPQIRDQVWDRVHDQVGIQVRNQAYNRVRDKIQEQ